MKKKIPVCQVGWLIGVLWDDAKGDVEEEINQENIKRHHRPTKIITYGIFVRLDRVGLSLAVDTIPEDTPTGYRGYNFIPRGMIREIWVQDKYPKVDVT